MSGSGMWGEIEEIEWRRPHLEVGARVFQVERGHFSLSELRPDQTDF